MVQFTELPDGWSEFEYETGPRRGDGPYTEELAATWASKDETIMVRAQHTVDANGVVTYPVMVEQQVSEDGLSTILQTHARTAEDRRGAEELAAEFMSEVNEGEHKLRVLGVQVPDRNDFVQFFTISDSQLPGEMTAEQLVEVVGSDDPDGIHNLPDEVTDEMDDEQMIQVDVFPRHKSDVEGVNDT